MVVAEDPAVSRQPFLVQLAGGLQVTKQCGGFGEVIHRRVEVDRAAILNTANAAVTLWSNDPHRADD